MIDQARQMENASHVAGGLVQRRAAAVVRGAMSVTVLVLIAAGTSVVVALALSGCGTDLFPPADVSTETADAGLPIGRLRIETSDGVFVLSDAAVPKDVAERAPAYVAWWNDFAAREMFVFGRLIETQGDVGHALLNLERDLGVDLDSLTDDNPEHTVGTDGYGTKLLLSSLTRHVDKLDKTGRDRLRSIIESIRRDGRGSSLERTLTALESEL